MTAEPVATVTWQAENSDVLPFGSVAVAEINWPTEAAVRPAAVKVTSPLALVLAVPEPR